MILLTMLSKLMPRYTWRKLKQDIRDEGLYGQKEEG